MADTPASNAAPINSPVSQDHTAPAPHDNVLNGTELQAQQIVAENRDPATETTQQVAGKGGAFDGMDILDNNAGNDARDLNDIGTASGSPMARTAPTALSPNLGVDRSVIGHTLTKPAAGHTETVHVQPGEVLATTFNPNTANLDMHGKDLVMQFNDGSKIVLTAFAADTQNMPSIALPNGALVAGGIIIAQLQGTNDDLFNLETAAGGTATTSGRFAYSDDFGRVIGLLDKLPPIGFTSLVFPQPEPRVTINDLANFDQDDDTTGSFVTNVSSIDAVFGVVSGAFEDWMPHKNEGDMSLAPAAFTINFTPQDNEVVDQVTISNIPAGVQFFYGTTGAYAPVGIVNGAVTFTAAQLAAGNIFILDTNKSDTDIPLNVSLLVRDPDTNATVVLSQSVVVVVDAVADLPELSSSISIDNTTVSSGAITGTENQPIQLNVNVNFSDNDGSETHTVILSGVPGEWTLNGAPGLTFTTSANADGTVTYTAIVTGNVNTTITFDPHEWTSANGAATLNLTARADESITDGELTTANNTAQVSTQFVVSIDEDVPSIIAIAPPTSIYEHTLVTPGIDQVGGDISVQFNTDSPGTLSLTLNGLEALNLTSHGETINYSLAQNGTLLIASTSTGVVFTVDLTSVAQNGGTQTFHYDFTLLQPVDHPDGTSADATTIPLQFIATDSDGDTVSGNFNVSIVDDLPVASDSHLLLDETNGLGTVVTGNLQVSYGADGAGSLGGNDQFSVVNGMQNGGLTANGVTVDVTLENGNYVGTANGAVVFRLDFNADGTYSFIQFQALDHNNPNDPNDTLTLNFGYTVRDYDGDSVSHNIVIDIQDDGPQARDDLATLVDGQAAIDGNLLANDTLSVDGPNLVTAVTSNGVTKTFAADGVLDNGVRYVLVDGQYGQIRVYEDGKYTYNYDTANHSGNLTENFTYTLTDRDGDSSTANLHLNIDDSAPGVAPNIVETVDETTDLSQSLSGTILVDNATQFALGNIAGAGDFSASGSLKDGSLTSLGSLVTVELVDGHYVATAADGHAVFDLSINNDGTYNFVQYAALDHNDASDANDVIGLNFHYVARDNDGDAVSGNITVNVRDDAPVANDDTNSVPDGKTEATGNLLDNDDLSVDTPNRVTEVSANGVTKSFATDALSDAGGKYVLVDGAFGQLKVYDTGKYTYNYDTANHGGTTVIAQYGYNGVGAGDPAAYGPLKFYAFDENSAFDANGQLQLGNAGQNGANVNYSDHGVGITSNAGPYQEIGQSTGELSEALAIELPNDTSRANVQLANFYSTGDGPDAETERGQWFAYNANGALVGSGEITADNTFNVGFGFRNFAITTIEPFKYLVFKALPQVEGVGQSPNGSNTDSDFQINNISIPGEDLKEEFTYVLTDKDGDHDPAKLIIGITDSGPTGATVYTSTLDETSDINQSISNTIKVDNATNYALGGMTGDAVFNTSGSVKGGVLSSNGVPVIVSLINGQYVGLAMGKEVFTLSIANNGTYTFVLHAPLDHADGNNANDTIGLNFAYTARDSDGDAVSSGITIVVSDDAPVAANDFRELADGSVTVNGNLLSNDTLSKDIPNLVSEISFNGTVKSFATDGLNDAQGRYVLLDGQYGQLKLYADGTYNYTYDTANHSGHLTEEFTYRLIDADGDSSNAKLTLTIDDKAILVVPDVSQTIDETSDINATINGVITVENAATFALGGSNGAADFTASGSLPNGALSSHGVPVTVDLVNGHYIGSANGQVVFDLSIRNDGTYTFVQHAALDHADASNPNDVISLNFQYVAKDSDGDGMAGHITVNIRDDAPIANDDADSIADGNTIATGNLLDNDHLSVDVNNHVTEVSGANGVVKHFDVDGLNDAGGRYVLVDGQYGQLKVYEDGKYTFTYDAANNGGTTNLADYSFVNGSSNAEVKLYAFAMGVDYEDANGHLQLQNAGLGGANVVFTGEGAGISSNADPFQEITFVDGKSEALAVELPIDTNRAVIQLGAFYSAGDGPDVESEHGQWMAYDAQGNLVGSGDITADNTFNLGYGLRNFAVTTIEPFKYLVFKSDVQVDGPGSTPGANTDSNYYVKSVSIPAQDILEEFKYVLTDKDGDHDPAKLVIGITDTQSPHVAPHIDVTTNGGAVHVEFDRFNLPENALGFPILSEGKNVENLTQPEQLGILTKTAETIKIDFPTTVSVSLIKDAGGAGFGNALGAFTLQNDGTIQDVKILYGNATTDSNSNPLKDLNATYNMNSSSGQVVFFILQDGFKNLQAAGLSDNVGRSTETMGHYDLVKQADGSLMLNHVNGDGSTTSFKDQVYTSLPGFNGDGLSHAIAGTMGANVQDAVTFGFEDLTGTNGSDRDFNDVVFNVTVLPHVEISLQTDPLIKTFNIVDDSVRMHEVMVEITQLKSGDTIAFDFAGTGYSLSGDHVLQNGVDTGISASIAKTVGGAYDVHLVGDAATTHYESLVKAISFSSNSDVLSSIGDRHVDITVTDEHGLSSHVSAIYSVTPPTGYDVQLVADDHGGTLTGHQYQDLLLGRAGDDVLIGGAGNDILAGGSGHNTLTGGDGSDTFLFLKHETGTNEITDFNHEQHDKLDISDLLAGGSYQPGISHVDDYVKVDHATGNVFVDAGGQGHFDNSTHIATINNSATLDSINVILNNDEGTKTVHTV